MNIKKAILLVTLSFLFTNIFSQAKFYGVYAGAQYFDKTSSVPNFIFGVNYEDYLDSKHTVRLNADFSFPQFESGKFLFWDLNAMYEYNLRKFGISRNNHKSTPFLAGGIGMCSLSPQNEGYTMNIPLTGGYKFLIGNSFIISLETSFVWTNLSMFTNKDVPYNINWYAMAGIRLMYNFYIEDHPCPAYY